MLASGTKQCLFSVRFCCVCSVTMVQDAARTAHVVIEALETHKGDLDVAKWGCYAVAFLSASKVLFPLSPPSPPLSLPLALSVFTLIFSVTTYWHSFTRSFLAFDQICFICRQFDYVCVPLRTGGWCRRPFVRLGGCGSWWRP